MKWSTGLRGWCAGVALMAFTMGAPQGAFAQEEEVRAAIVQVFDGMRTANSAMVREVFAPDARFAVIGGDPVQIREMSPEGWLDAIDGSEGTWDEQVYDIQILVDGNMASAWVPYTFYLDGEISHCGINSIEFLRDADGWKVTQLSDTRRRENCPDPHGG